MNNIVKPTGQSPISNGKIPREGPRALRVVFKIRESVPAVVSVDLQNFGLSFVQTVFVDNSSSTVPVNLEFSGTGQTFTVLAQTQVFLPVMAGNPIEIKCVGAGDLDVPCQLINVPMSPIVYSAAPSSVIIEGVVPITGNVTALCTQEGEWYVRQRGDWAVEQAGQLPWFVQPAVSGFEVEQGNAPWSITFAAYGAELASGEVSGSSLIKSGAGRLFGCNILTAGSAPGSIRDGSIGARLLALPNAVGSYVFSSGVPFSSSLYADLGTGQIVNLFYT